MPGAALAGRVGARTSLRMFDVIRRGFATRGALFRLGISRWQVVVRIVRPPHEHVEV